MQQLVKSEQIKVMCHGYVAGNDKAIFCIANLEDIWQGTKDFIMVKLIDKLDTETQHEHAHLFNTEFIHKDNLHIIGEYKEKEDCIVVDIDGVLNIFNSQSGEVLLKDGCSRHWSEITPSVDDKPSTIFHNLINFRNVKRKRVIFLTARGESQRVVTEDFIERNIHRDIKWSLMMRGFNSNSVSAESLKVQMIQTCILPYFNVLLFVDDTKKNIEKVNQLLPDIECVWIDPEKDTI